MKKLNKSNSVILYITDVNDQEYSPVINMTGNFPEIVKGQMRYLEYSGNYHIYYNKEEDRIIICNSRSVCLFKGDLDISEIAKYYYSKTGEDKLAEFEKEFKKILTVNLESMIYRILNSIMNQGFNNVRFKSDRGGTIEDDIEEFVFYLYIHICKNLGYIEDDLG